MAVAMVGNERVEVKFAHNIWTDKQAVGLIAGVALIALLAVAGSYAICPLRGLGLSSVGWWMLGSSALIGIVELAVVLVLIKQSEAHLKTDKHKFANLDRFQGKERAFDYLIFEEKGHSFIAFYIQDGASKQFRVFRNNEISGLFLENIMETHEWVLPEQLS